MDSTAYRADIDGLRMIAVLPVVLNHAGIPGFPGGFIGVDIFFVISGFLITRILRREIEEGRFSIWAFYERRARRILPALFLVLSVSLIAGWWILSPAQYNELGKSVVATLTFSSNIWFWYGANDYFSHGAELQPLLHTWSLAVEEQFYLFFPLLLLAVASRTRAGWIKVVWIVVILSFVLSLWMTNAAPTANFYLVPTRAWELGAGSLLALGAFPSSRHRSIHEIAGWLGLALLCASVVLITHSTPFPGLTAVPPVLGATLVIFAGSSSKQPVGVSLLLAWPPFVWVGLISYSLYLWHWPILVAAKVTTQTLDLPLTIAILCIFLAICLAWLSWRYVERPFRATAGPNALSGSAILSMSMAGTAVLGVAGVFIVLQSGLVGQFPKGRIAAYQTAIQRDPLDMKCTNIGTSCLIGAPDVTPNIAVWGDSHMAAMLPGLDSWSKQNDLGLLAYTKTGCPPLLDIYRYDEAPNHNCDLFNASVLEEITRNQSIETVILFGRWALAVEGQRAEHEPGPEVVLAQRGSDSVDVSVNALLFEQGLSSLLAQLRSEDLQVLIIGGTPEIGRSVPDLVLRYGDDVPAAFQPRGVDFDNRNARANDILDRLSETYNVRVLTTRYILCSEQCEIHINGTALYRDDDHLSTFGARWLVPKLIGDVLP